jgi:hypothetical protein
MAAAKSIHLYYNVFDNSFFDPRTGRIVGDLDVVRQDYTRLRVQAVSTREFDLASDLTAPAAAQVALTGWSTNVLFAIKTQAQYDAAAGDFTLATTGFDTTDTAWHSLAAGRFTHTTAITSSIAAKQYLGVLRLQDSSSNYYTLGNFPMTARVTGEVITGSEATTPAGVTSASWVTGTITVGLTYVDIVVAGLTTAAQVIPVLMGSSDAFTNLTYSASSGSLRIIAAAAAPAGGYAVAALIVSL